MNSYNSEQHISFSNFLLSTRNELQIKQIIENLAATPRSISSKFLYDETGSRLYNEITLLTDYYLTNLEMSLIDEFANNNKTSICNSEIVDLGCGNEKKVSLLFDVLDNLDSIVYTPLDISVTALKETAVNLVNRYPGIRVHCIAADFMSQLNLLPESTMKRIFCFLGSTIGNLSCQQRILFFSKIRELMSSDDLFLLGVDLVKQKSILEQAYNDKSNLTARFNRNILNVVNSIVQTDFKPSDFEHIAFFNEIDSRIEMHLKASHDMTVTSPYLSFPIKLEKNEMIHTENSYKFTMTRIASEIEYAGLHIKMANSDSKNQYSLLQVNKKQ